MNWEQALRRRLLDDPAVVALIGTHPDDDAPCIDWTVSRQDSVNPKIVLTLVSDPRPQTHDGPDSIRASRVQVDIYADDKDQSVPLREAAIAALLSAGTFNEIRFDRARVDAVRDRSAKTEDSVVFREAVDFFIWHKG